MLRRFRLPVFVAIAALLTGCFQVESVLSVRPDGSAVLTEQISADGLMGLVLRKSATETSIGDDRSERYGDGVRVASVEQTVMPGAVQLTTVYDVPDVSQLRYDISEAFDANDISGGGDADDPGASPFLFAFTPAAGGAPAHLRVTVPQMGDFTDLGDLEQSPIGELFGGEDAEPGDAFDETMVMFGNLATRFSIQADGLLGTDAGWVDGDRVTLAEVSMGTFLQHMQATGSTETVAVGADGVDLPGYRIAPQGVATIRFR